MNWVGSQKLCVSVSDFTTLLSCGNGKATFVLLFHVGRLYFWGAHKAEVRTLTPPKESLLFMLTFSITFAVKELFCWDLLLLETKSKVAAMALLVFEETSNFPTVTHTHCREEGGLAYTSSS